MQAAPQPKDVLRLASAIVDAEESLNRLRQQWEDLFQGVESKRSKPAPIERRTRSASHNSLPSKLLRILYPKRDEAFTIAVLADLVGDSPLAVGRALYRLHTTGKVSNVGRGIYQYAGGSSAEERDQTNPFDFHLEESQEPTEVGS